MFTWKILFWIKRQRYSESLTVKTSFFHNVIQTLSVNKKVLFRLHLFSTYSSLPNRSVIQIKYGARQTARPHETLLSVSEIFSVSQTVYLKSMLKSHGALMKSYGIVLESNPLTTQPIFDHPQAIHDPNTGFIHPLIHMYPWKGVSSLSNMVQHHLQLQLKNLN